MPLMVFSVASSCFMKCLVFVFWSDPSFWSMLESWRLRFLVICGQSDATINPWETHFHLFLGFINCFFLWSFNIFHSKLNPTLGILKISIEMSSAAVKNVTNVMYLITSCRLQLNLLWGCHVSGPSSGVPYFLAAHFLVCSSDDWVWYTH